MVDIRCGGRCTDWQSMATGEDGYVEAIILLPDEATVEVFKRGEGALEQTAAHDSASSYTGQASTCKAYAIADDSVFNLCLNGELLPCLLGAGLLDINLLQLHRAYQGRQQPYRLARDMGDSFCLDSLPVPCCTWASYSQLIPLLHMQGARSGNGCDLFSLQS